MRSKLHALHPVTALFDFHLYNSVYPSKSKELEHLKLPLFKTETRRAYSICFQVIMAWNMVPLAIRKQESLNNFKRKIFEYVQCNI